MNFRFNTPDLQKWAVCGEKEKTGFPHEVIKAYRKRLIAIQAAKDENDLRAVKGNHFEKLQGSRSHQYSLRLNDQWRLIVEVEGSNPQKTILVVGIEDYH